MSIKSIFIYLFRILLLTLALTVGGIIGGVVSGLANRSTQQTPEEASNALFILLIINLVNSLLLSFVLLRSRWRGWKLVLAVAGIYFGIITFMSQLETFFFGEAMGISKVLLAQIIVLGILTAGLVAPIAVLIFRKWKGTSEVWEYAPLQDKGLRWKLPVLTVLYVFLYLVFGYFIAWQSPAVRLYYTDSTELLPFIQHLEKLVRQDAGLLLFQVFRGLLWIGFVVLIVQCCKGNKWELALWSGLLLGVFFTLQLFLPNPFMPEEVRMVHLLETASSNFLFGVIAAYWLLATSAPAPILVSD